jgi:hypothetical protein
MQKSTTYVPETEGPREVQPFTWQVLAQGAAVLLLGGAVLLWCAMFFQFTAPTIYRLDARGQAVITAGSALYGLFEGTFSIILAIGCAIAPPVFFSSILPQSVANNVLAWLYSKYGTAGYVFCAVSAAAFTLGDCWLASVFWASQEVFSSPAFTASQRSAEITILVLTLMSVYLLVGFTSWAISRLTPRQLLAAIAESQNAATILRAEQLREMLAEVTKLYGLSILKAEHLAGGMEALGDQVANFAAAVAVYEEEEALAFKRLAQLMSADQRGEELYATIYGQAHEEHIRIGFKNMMLTVETGMRKHLALAEHAREASLLMSTRDNMVMSSQPRALAEMPRAEALTPYADQVEQRMATLAGRAPEPPRDVTPAPAPVPANVAPDVPPASSPTQSDSARSSSPTESDIATADALSIAWQAYGQGLFKAAMLPLIMPISLRSAQRCLQEWSDAGLAIKSNMQGLYTFDITKLAELEAKGKAEGVTP